MDTSTCEECEDVDGEVMELGDDRRPELHPPYVKCLGGDRCRCLQIAILSDGSEINVDDVPEEAYDEGGVLMRSDPAAHFGTESMCVGLMNAGRGAVVSMWRGAATGNSMMKNAERGGHTATHLLAHDCAPALVRTHLRPSVVLQS